MNKSIRIFLIMVVILLSGYALTDAQDFDGFPVWNYVYGDGLEIDRGDLIEFRGEDGRLLSVEECRVEEDGQFGFCNVYNQTTFGAEYGAVDGETISIYLNGQLCEENFVFVNTYRKVEIESLTPVKSDKESSWKINLESTDGMVAYHLLVRFGDAVPLNIYAPTLEELAEKLKKYGISLEWE